MTPCIIAYVLSHIINVEPNVVAEISLILIALVVKVNVNVRVCDSFLVALSLSYIQSRSTKELGAFQEQSLLIA